MSPLPEPLDSRLAQLREEVEPPRDLWPAIRERLERAQEPQHVAARRRWLPVAAVAAGVALASLLLIRRDPPAIDLADATTHASAAREAAWVQTHAAVESEYERLVPQLAPATRQRVAQALETIRRAEADIAAALAEDPANPLLLRLRERAARQEIELMTTVTRDAVAELPRSET